MVCDAVLFKLGDVYIRLTFVRVRSVRSEPKHITHQWQTPFYCKRIQKIFEFRGFSYRADNQLKYWHGVLDYVSSNTNFCYMRETSWCSFDSRTGFFFPNMSLLNILIVFLQKFGLIVLNSSCDVFATFSLRNENCIE